MNKNNKNIAPRILIVEDEAILAMDLEEILQQSGYSVVGLCDSGEEAVEESSRLYPDVIIMDITLKGDMTGIDAAVVINQKLDIPIIFLTSHDEDDVISSAQKSGSFSYLVKPVNVQELRANIEIAILSQKARNQLKDINRTKDKVFAIISHDLRNPIAAIKRTIEIVKENFDSLSKEEISSFVDELAKTSSSLHQLNENLLNWAKLQGNQVSVKIEKIRVSYIIKYVQEVHLGLIREKQITILNKVSDEVIVLCDLQSVSIVVSNLLVNAIKFSRPGGTITIRAGVVDNLTELSIEDEGIGIEPEKLEEIFEGRISLQGTLHENGTGLGLLTCKELIEKNNGKIFVTSEWGKGTNVKFTLPAAVDGVKVLS
jgi:two-component system, sensor histidine kinase and response regulator